MHIPNCQKVLGKRLQNVQFIINTYRKLFNIESVPASYFFDWHISILNSLSFLQAVDSRFKLTMFPYIATVPVCQWCF
jgi:hypothetical protein